MRIAEGVHVIETSFLGRPLSMPLFRGEEVALVDTGLTDTPEKSIIPYLESVGVKPLDLTWVIVTHAHADHFGGNEAIHQWSWGNVQFAAHRLDQTWIEDPPTATREGYGHYVDLGLMTADGLDGAVEISGGGIKLDRVLEGGETFDLGDGLELEIVFTPGHSPGSVCVLEHTSKVLAQGEAVAGVAQMDVSGNVLTVPFYEDPSIYLDTVAAMAGLDFEVFVPSHLPIMDREQAKQFFAESVDFVLRFDEAVQRQIMEGPQPTTSIEFLESMDGLWDLYPADMGLFTLLESHVGAMITRGQVEGSMLDTLTWSGPLQDALGPNAEKARQAIEGM